MLHRPRVAIETLGCKLNVADSELLAHEFLQSGYNVVPANETADVYVLNTCTVTHVADAKARQKLRTARRRQPSAFIVATGCYPARDEADLTAMAEVDLVVDNAGKPDIVGLVAQRMFPQGSPEPLSGPTPPAAFAFHRTRAFVKLQEGCNDHCSYCIIPKTRGASRFFDADAVIAAVQARTAAGHPEVVLTGTQIGDYGIAMPGARRLGADPRDQASEGDPLAALLARLLAETTAPRIRLSSLQPQDVTPALVDLWQDSRLCPHFHLPLQSGSDAVLRAMRRRYTAAEFLATVQRLRATMPHVAITSDLIVGFPGETETDFHASLAVCEAAEFADLHVFPYSSRPRTLAERMAANPALVVPDATKQARAHAALALSSRLRAQHLAGAVGHQRPVLWEEQHRDTDGVQRWFGLTDTYLRAASAADDLQRGDITPFAITGVLGDHVVGSTQRP